MPLPCSVVHVDGGDDNLTGRNDTVEFQQVFKKDRDNTRRAIAERKKTIHHRRTSGILL